MSNSLLFFPDKRGAWKIELQNDLATLAEGGIKLVPSANCVEPSTLYGVLDQGPEKDRSFGPSFSVPVRVC